MAEEKKTQLGTTPGRTQRPTGSTPAVAAVGTIPGSATGTPAPTEIMEPGANPKAKTSYLPQGPVAVDTLLGATVADRYKIIRKLGEGGMGSVYLALHMVLEKQVALKVLHGEFARKPDLVERFMQEAKAASRIRHENVIDISDFGATPDGIVFFAMELLQGHDLHEEVTRAKLAGSLLPWSRTKKIFLQICSALAAAHARGIVHRDLKPENVYLVEFLGDPDFVKLLDFGIAKVTDVSGNEEGARKLTKTGMLFGTPEYMSPEQARGDKVDHRVDIYAMGCILFQLVCNSVPFQAENFMGVLSQHLTAEPPQIAPEVFDQIGAPRALAAVIDKALAKDPNQRWQTIEEFAAAVREVSGDAPASDKSVKMRAASVPAPTETTRKRPPTGTVEAVSDRGTGRVKTQWTGNLKVPEVPVEQPAAPAKSKLPLIIGALVLVGGGIATAIVATSGGKDSAGQGSAALGSGSAAVVAVGSGSAAGSAVPETPPPPVEDPLPAMVEIVFESNPKGANVIDVANGTDYGKTPTSFSLPGSKAPRQFRFQLKGYGSRTVELVPNRPKIEFKQELVKGASSTTTVTQVPDPSLKKPDTAVGAGSATVAKPDTGTTTAVTRPDTTKPDTGSAAAVTKPDTTKPDTTKPDTTKPDTGSAAAVTKPDTTKPDTTKPDTTKPDTGSADCAEEPCLKSFP